MKSPADSPPRRRLCQRLRSTAALIFLAHSSLHAEPPEAAPLPVRQQQIELRAGWNAVWLEVDPVNPDADQLFSGTSIDVCARYFRPASSMEYIKSPSEAPFRAEGWGVWYAPAREEAEIRSLDAVRGPAAYLIHSRAAGSWAVTGSVRFKPLEWKSNAFTLTGLSVESVGAPTFNAYFAGSEGRVGSKIFRLIEGRWQNVSGTTVIRAGEAYWIFAAGDSTYQGPLTLGLSGQGLDFSPSSGDLARLPYRNTGTAAANPSVVFIGPESATTQLPLIRLTPQSGSLASSLATLSGPLTPLAPGEGDTLELALQRGLMTAPHQSGTLRISDGAGSLWWVPVRAAR